MDRPLYLDERLEQLERARFTHVLDRWLKKLLPWFDFGGPAPGRAWRRAARRSVETQLLQRPGFTPELWNGYGPAGEVVAILSIIRKQLSLPNHNFIPDDPVVLLMSSGYDKDDVYALLDLEERYAVKYTDEEVERIRREEWTLGQFVKDLLERSEHSHN